MSGWFLLGIIFFIIFFLAFLEWQSERFGLGCYGLSSVIIIYWFIIWLLDVMDCVWCGYLFFIGLLFTFFLVEAIKDNQLTNKLEKEAEERRKMYE
jgi:hypothetical protein